MTEVRPDFDSLGSFGLRGPAVALNSGVIQRAIECYSLARQTSQSHYPSTPGRARTQYLPAHHRNAISYCVAEVNGNLRNAICRGLDSGPQGACRERRTAVKVPTRAPRAAIIEVRLVSPRHRRRTGGAFPVMA